MLTMKATFEHLNMCYVSPGECSWLKLHGASRSGADARPLFERELQRGESEQHICSPDSTKQASWAEKERASTNFPRWTYAASKGAINILTKNMALDLAKYRIRVNSVSPGWIWSPEVAKVIFKSILRSNYSDHSLVSWGGQGEFFKTIYRSNHSDHSCQCERIQNRWYKTCCSQIIPVSTPRQLQMGVAIIGNPLGANSTSAAGFCNTSLTVIYDNILILF